MPKGTPKTPESAERMAAGQFKPGQSGNPGGTAKGVRVSTVVARLLDMTSAEFETYRKRKDLTKAELIAFSWVDKAEELPDKQGAQFLDMVLDRTEGRVKQTHEFNSGQNPYSSMELEGVVVMAQRLLKAKKAQEEADGRA